MMMNNERTGLYSLLIKRLEEVKESSGKEVIPFPLVFEKLCRNFSMTKKECWDVLFLLNDLGLIKIIALHGIRLNFFYPPLNIASTLPIDP